MRLDQGKTAGTSAMVRPGVRSPRFMLFMGLGAVPVVALFTALAVVLGGGCVAIGVATLLSTHSATGAAWFLFALLPIAFVAYGYRMSGVVVDRDRVYKGTHSRKSFANRREIAKVVYRIGTAQLQDAQGRTVLALDGGMLGRRQAEQPASQLGRPFELERRRPAPRQPAKPEAAVGPPAPTKK
ncbi:MAG TPA: hypothetical protein VGX23_25720 [Actinocrinis sp.]|nr:hypothetical protein [Actinocrinis sp.]